MMNDSSNDSLRPDRAARRSALTGFAPGHHWVWGAALAFAAQVAFAQPDLTGTYDVGTLTPLERPEVYGENLFLTDEEASKIEAQVGARMAAAQDASDPDRAAPAAGGRIGGYNAFWIDRGETANSVEGRFRTSIINSPPNGRIPPMTTPGAARRQGFLDEWRIIWRSPDPTVGKNDGSAWWLDLPGAAPYDHLEQRPLAERCIIGSRSTAGPPMLPNIYNNHKRILQTEDHVMILTEMNHDARVVHLNADHRPDQVRGWLGDSTGFWRGDTLVVETTNFGETPPISGSDQDLKVTEEFELKDDGSLLYRFRVEDPTIWSEPWGGEYTWARSEGKVYEYACHEGNYALGNVMRGARLLERESAETER